MNDGTLLISGSIGNSDVTVNNADSTLASGTTGTIGSNVTVNSCAILAAGGINGVGAATLDSGDLALNSGSIFGEALNSGSFASVTRTANSLTQGSFTINGSNPTWTAFTAVPEPTSALAALVLGAGLLLRRLSS